MAHAYVLILATLIATESTEKSMPYRNISVCFRGPLK